MKFLAKKNVIPDCVLATNTISHLTEQDNKENVSSESKFTKAEKKNTIIQKRNLRRKKSDILEKIRMDKKEYFEQKLKFEKEKYENLLKLEKEKQEDRKKRSRLIEEQNQLLKETNNFFKIYLENTLNIEIINDQ